MIGTRTVVAAESTEVKNVSSFIFGGRAEFTIRNLESKTGFGYRVTECKTKKGMFFVWVKGFEGSDWKYAGFLARGVASGGGVKFIQGKRGVCASDSAPVKGILYALKHGDSPLPRPMIMHHHGKCCGCGKSLNDAVSVERGFGPVCWERHLGHQVQ